MADVMLTLIVPDDLARPVEDVLLSRPDLVPGFTSTAADGHGSAVALVAPSELVEGHAPRNLIRLIGAESQMRGVLALLREQLPKARLFYWLVPVIEMGHL